MEEINKLIEKYEAFFKKNEKLYNESGDKSKTLRGYSLGKVRAYKYILNDLKQIRDGR